MPLFQPKDINAPVLDQFSLKGKVIAVTSGARGIGVEIVRGLAEAGADVALIYNSSNRAGEIAAAIARDTRVRVEPYQADVT
jgi:sorbose reductase